MESPAINRLLVVDDDPIIAEFIRSIGEGLGYKVVHLPAARHFDRTLAEFDPTVITLDLNLPDTDGVSLLRRLGERGCRAPILIMSGVDSRTLNAVSKLTVARNLNVVDVLPKPVEPELLAEKLQALTAEPPVPAEVLEAAIVAGELVVHYLPRVSLASAELPLVGVEALLRWPHPDRGLVPPGAFLPVAEQHGMMNRLTDYVLERSIEQISTWKRTGLDLQLAVNFDPRLVDDYHFPDRLVRLLAEHGLPAGQLTLDMTEVAGIEDPDLTRDVLTRLRIHGVGLSLDDFGVGYSPLTQLRALPFSELKIAEQLVAGLAAEESESDVFVRTIVQLGHGLGLRVCAEGVEHEGALQRLRAAGCDAAQGYLIAPPMPPGQLQKLAASWDGVIADEQQVAG